MENKPLNISEVGEVKHGVKCDTKGCDFVAEFKEFEEYEPYINKPCPNCGANLLTQDDYDLVHTFYRLGTDEEFVKEFTQENPMPELPQEIMDMVANLEDPDVKSRIRVEFLDGIPKMTSDNPEVQAIIDAIDEFIESNNGVVKKLDNLDQIH